MSFTKITFTSERSSEQSSKPRSDMTLTNSTTRKAIYSRSRDLYRHHPSKTLSCLKLTDLRWPEILTQSDVVSNLRVVSTQCCTYKAKGKATVRFHNGSQVKWAAEIFSFLKARVSFHSFRPKLVSQMTKKKTSSMRNDSVIVSNSNHKLSQLSNNRLLKDSELVIQMLKAAQCKERNKNGFYCRDKPP